MRLPLFDLADDGEWQTNGLDGQQASHQTFESESESDESDSVTSVALMQLLEKQQYRCALTGIELTPETVSLDHIVPVTDGGQDVLSNVQLVHVKANRMKGTLSLSEFLEMCQAVCKHLGS